MIYRKEFQVILRESQDILILLRRAQNKHFISPDTILERVNKITFLISEIQQKRIDEILIPTEEEIRLIHRIISRIQTFHKEIEDLRHTFSS